MDIRRRPVPALTIRDADPRTLLTIYLRDHLAGATAGVQLARRLWRNNCGSPLEPFLRRLADDIEQDRRSLEQLMGHLGVAVAPAKNALAVVAERAGRAKLNGQILGYSPLSRLIELEGLSAGVETKLNLWHSLQASLPKGSVPADIDFEQLATRAETQRRELEQHRTDAACKAFGTGSPRGLI